MDKILLAIDFSQKTVPALDYAKKLAASFGAELVLVHGIEPIAQGAEEEEDEVREVEQFYEELRQKARRGLEKVSEDLEGTDLAYRSVIEVGERWEVVLAQAEKEDVDVIVVGQGRRTTGESRRLGTTSQRVYFHARRPVLTVPSND